MRVIGDVDGAAARDAAAVLRGGGDRGRTPGARRHEAVFIHGRDGFVGAGPHELPVIRRIGIDRRGQGKGVERLHRQGRFVQADARDRLHHRDPARRADTADRELDRRRAERKACDEAGVGDRGDARVVGFPGHLIRAVGRIDRKGQRRRRALVDGEVRVAEGDGAGVHLPIDECDALFVGIRLGIRPADAVDRQPVIIAERVVRDRGRGAGDRDGRELSAACKRFFADARHAARDHNGFQRVAVEKGIAGDRRHPSAQGHVRERVAVIEHVFAEP